MSDELEQKVTALLHEVGQLQRAQKEHEAEFQSVLAQLSPLLALVRPEGLPKTVNDLRHDVDALTAALKAKPMPDKSYPFANEMRSMADDMTTLRAQVAQFGERLDTNPLQHHDKYALTRAKLAELMASEVE